MISNMLILFSPFAPLKDSLISFLLLIDAKIYSFFAYLYRIYLQLAQVKIFDVNAFDTIINNIYVIFGVVALFLTTFTLLKTLVNPDDLNNSATSIRKLVMRLILAIGLTAVLPFAFDFLYDVQASIFSWQVIPKLVGINNKSDESMTAIASYTCNEEICTCDSEICIKITEEDGKLVEKEYSKNANLKDDGEEEIKLKVGVINGADLSYVNEQQGNILAFYVLNGFIYPTESQDVKVTKSTVDAFNQSGILWSAGGCLAALGTGFIIGSVVPGIGNLTGGVVGLLTCVAGAGLGHAIKGFGFLLTSENYTWNDFTRYAMATGDFDKVVPFTEAILNGELNYTFIASTIAGIIMCYMMFSFCLDLGIRAAKLIFYQILAPISFLLSALPKNNDLLGNWFKAVLTTWAEVFIRIFCVCGVALLIQNVFSFESLENIGLLAKAIIVLGLVAFAKQIPKLIEEVTGIKSGNMKLGIKDKLAAGGAFTAGAIIGGGITSGVRNLTNAGRNIKNNWNNDKKNGVKTGKRIAHAFKGAGSGLFSTAAGSVSGAFRSGKSGWGAKSGKDMKNAASSGAKGAAEARTKRANYRAAHSAGKGFIDDLRRTTIGHIKDAGISVGNWAGYQNIEDLKRQNRAMDEIKNSRDSFDSTIDDLISKEMAKGNFSLDTGTEIVDFTDIKESQNALNEARINGTAEYKGNTYRLADLETIHNNNIRNARYQIQDDVLIGNEDWNKLNSSVRAKLAQARVRAIEFKGAIRNNANESVVQAAHITGAELDDNVAYKLSKVKSQDIIGVDSVDNFKYGTMEYTDVNYDLNTKKIKWRDGNTGRLYEKILNEKYDKGLIVELEKNTKYKYSYNYADNDKIDAMNENIKIKHGENDVQIASKEQQKTDDKK